GQGEAPMLIRRTLSLALAFGLAACNYQADEPERNPDTRPGTAASPTAADGRVQGAEPRSTGISRQAETSPPPNPTGRGVQADTGRGRGEAPEALDGHGGTSRVSEQQAIDDCRDLEQPEQADCIRRVRLGYDVTGDPEDRTAPP